MARSLDSGWNQPTQLRRRARSLGGALAAAIVACLANGAAAQADLSVSHVSYAATEVAGSSDGDGIVGPGDSFSLNETVESANSGGTLTNVQGVLQTGASGVSITQPNSAYPNLVFGQPTANSTPFQGVVSNTLDCGVNVPLTLQLTATQGTTPGSQAVPFVMQTGAQGAFNAYTSTQVPLTIPSPGQVISRINVPTAGRVKRMKVTLGSLTESYDGNLQIDLIAPDGTDVQLVDPSLSNNGQNFQNTTFDDSAANPAITSGTGAPYSGSYKPAGRLSDFIGHQQQGTWELKITDSNPGDQGSLNSWSASEAPAVCTTAPVGSFTATPNPAQVGNAVSFDGSGSTSPSPGATITDYKWNFGDGTPVVDSGSTPTTNHSYSARGQYTATLTVTDSSSKTSQATLTVSVTQPPVAAISASPSSPVSGQQVTFNASGSTHDPAGSIVDYKWDLDGSGNYATDTGSTPTVTASYPTQRTVAVSVRVTDDVGASSIATINVTVGNAPPVAAFSTPSPILVGSLVTFDGSASSDVDGSVVDHKWDLNGSGTYATDTGLNPQVGTTYTSPGLVSVGLQVTDDQGAVTTVRHTIQVTRPPVAQLKATPAAPTSAQAVTLDASGSSDPDGAITDYQWDLDGSGRFAISTGSTSFLTHTFAAGTYTIRVRVTDNFGATAQTSMTLTVSPAPAGGPGSGAGLLAQVGPTVGGSPKAGIAALTGSDLTTIVAGSDDHFAAITGTPVRKASVVAKKGLWVNLLSDRPASFALTVSVAASDARRLHIASVQRKPKPGLRGLASVTAMLSAAGQRPYDVVLPSRVRRQLARVRGTLQLIVAGYATDSRGHRTALTRVFEVKR